MACRRRRTVLRVTVQLPMWLRPRPSNGAYITTDIGVGAHQAHLLAGHVAAPVSCTECHVIPNDLLTHPDLQNRPATVTFGTKASLHGATPAWDRSTASCANTYCHGSQLSNAATRPAPIWTKVDGTQRSCGSCHGYPPGGTHPSSVACATCHGEVVNADHTIKNLNLHINGNVEFFVQPVNAGIAGAAGTGGAAPTSGSN